MDTEYLSAEDCEELQGEGYPQGKTPYLWHKNRHNHDKWELYKRNPHDMSADADKMGFNRWVSAVTHEQAKNWRDRRKLSPVVMPDRIVASVTFRSGHIPNPRQSACLFATATRTDLVSITETYASAYLEVTVYFWKDEID